MKKLIHLSLDAMGGDYAPEIIVNGAAQSKIRHPNLKFSFFGNENKLLPLISPLKILENSSIIHTDEIINRYLEIYDKILHKIKKCIDEEESIDKLLNGPVAHSGFNRLN